jgi:hypothetical protein
MTVDYQPDIVTSQEIASLYDQLEQRNISAREASAKVQHHMDLLALAHHGRLMVIQRILALQNGAIPSRFAQRLLTGKMKDGDPCTITIEGYDNGARSAVIIRSEHDKKVTEQHTLLEPGTEFKWIDYLGVDIESLSPAASNV